RDMFVGFNPEETLQSLVIHNCTDANLGDDEILNKCKEMLINIASADGIVRSRNSGLSIDIMEVNRWRDAYFHDQHHENLIPQHQSLIAYLENSLTDILNNVYTFEEIVTQEVLWCLLSMKFPSTSESVDYIKLLVEQIPKHEEFLDCLKTRTFEWLDEKVSEEWTLEVASNKTDLYLYSSFFVSLQTYIRNKVREPISKLLCVTERLSGLSPLFHDRNIDDLYVGDERSDDLFEFWKQIFMNSKIVDIEYLSSPKPDIYQIPTKQRGNKFPFSTYFIDQINKFKRLYQEDRTILEEDEKNYDETGELRTDVIENCVERFTENVCSVIPSLKSPKLFEEPEIYFKDFVSAVLPKFGKDNGNVKLFEWLILYHLNQQIPNPVRLHVFWWENSESVLAELQLMLMCPEVVKIITSAKTAEITDYDFEAYLLEEIVNIFMKRIGLINTNRAIERTLHIWQRDVTNILSLATKLSTNVFVNPSLQRLRIYNDLSKSLELQDLLEIRRIEIDEGSREMLSERLIDNVFKRLAGYKDDEVVQSSQRSFINRCLNTLSNESPVRLFLYTKILSPDPLPLSFSIVHRIFNTEHQENEDVFFELIKNPLEVLKYSERLQLINDILEKDVDSPIACLCTDVLQIQFFGDFGIGKLSQYFLKATEVLITTDVKPLQLISAIALLKSFGTAFWESARSLKNSLNNPISFLFEDADYMVEVDLEDINKRMDAPHPLIHSFLLYLLKILKTSQGFSMDDVKRFCNINRELLPWLGGIAWTVKDMGRMDFIPYWYIEQYNQAEHAANRIISRGDETSMTNLLKTINNVNEKDVVNLRISFSGMIMTKLYLVRASRDWNQAETILAQKTRNALEKTTLPKFYKEILTKFLKNEHPLIKLSVNDGNSKLYICSVISHVISVCLSLPQNSSPLACYLQNLQDCQNTFILTCPSDEQTVILNALMEQVGDCGNVTVASTCPQCKKTIGGQAYNAPAPGNNRLDAIPMTQTVNAKAQAGYLIETRKTEDNYSVRQMSPASYRVLHLFVHAIIGILAPSQIVTKFVNGQTNKGTNIADAVQYCQRHINNDWAALKNILACGDEQLALVLHSILSHMAQVPLKGVVTKLRTSVDRDDWEKNFSTQYASPFVKNAMGTAAEFRKMLEAKSESAQIKIETEINEVMKRQEARSLSFRNFITKECNDDNSGESRRLLDTAFMAFTDAWNALIPHVKRYKCQTLHKALPKMTENLPVVYGLVEPVDESVYLCAILDFLVQLQNNFLKDVIEISPGKCQSLKFLEHHSNAKVEYHLQSIRLDSSKAAHIVLYNDVTEIFKYSQFDLRIGHGQEISYDLFKIEAELAHLLVYEKAFIEQDEQELHMDRFSYHKELFQGSMTILSEIKALVTQENIPEDKKMLFIGNSKNSYGLNHQENFELSLGMENPKKLLSALEMIICFLKRTSGGDCEMLITDYIEKWMKLTVLKDDDTSYKLLKRSGLQLKHVVALYELVEEHVADVVATCIHPKYQAKLNDLIEQEIMEVTSFDQQEEEPLIGGSSRSINSRIPAEAFVTALKRFILRHLSIGESIVETIPLSSYLVQEEALECWPDTVSQDVLQSKFPTSLLISHTLEAYIFVKEELKNIQSRKQRKTEEKEAQNKNRRTKSIKGKGKSQYDFM
ncbi:7651_t:CDS:2, partial [Acaulospora colombiana]